MESVWRSRSCWPASRTLSTGKCERFVGGSGPRWMKKHWAFGCSIQLQLVTKYILARSSQLDDTQKNHSNDAASFDHFASVQTKHFKLCKNRPLRLTKEPFEIYDLCGRGAWWKFIFHRTMWAQDIQRHPKTSGHLVGHRKIEDPPHVTVHFWW